MRQQQKECVALYIKQEQEVDPSCCISVFSLCFSHHVWVMNSNSNWVLKLNPSFDSAFFFFSFPSVTTMGRPPWCLQRDGVSTKMPFVFWRDWRSRKWKASTEGPTPNWRPCRWLIVRGEQGPSCVEMWSKENYVHIANVTYHLCGYKSVPFQKVVVLIWNYCWHF